MQWIVAKFISLLIVTFLVQACQWSSSSDDANTQMPPSISNYRAADVLACDAGELSYESKQQALAVFNAIRDQHGLQPVHYDDTSDEWVMQAALVMAANKRLEHEVDPSWRCYSEAAKQGAQKSNIGLYKSSNTSVQAIEQYEKTAIAKNLIGYITEIHHVEPGNVGHRRWALNPFLNKVAYGQVSDIVNGQFVSSSAVRVIYDESQQSDSTYVTDHDNIIAYPYGDYPAKYFAQGAQLSFSVLINESDFYANALVDYQQAKVVVSQGANRWVIAERDIQYDSIDEGQFTLVGLPNHLQFSFAQIRPNLRYEVEISDVRVCSSSRWLEKSSLQILDCSHWINKDYHYSFKIIP